MEPCSGFAPDRGVATPTGLTESGFLHALDILQIVISDSRENPKWQELHRRCCRAFAVMCFKEDHEAAVLLKVLCIMVTFALT